MRYVAITSERVFGLQLLWRHQPFRHRRFVFVTRGGALFSRCVETAMPIERIFMMSKTRQQVS
jgi:hypothetical protein